MKTAAFIDFDDSFSYNVIQELTEVGLEVTVINWIDFTDLPKVDVLVLGPGPGRPQDYARIFPQLQSWLKSHRPYFGICLGHQIYFHLQEFEIQRSKHPVHGQKISLNLDQYWQQYLNLPQEVKVQRYNSLAVLPQRELPHHRIALHDDEIVMAHGPNVLTYQFHPESVGTNFRQSFFRPLLKDSL